MYAGYPGMGMDYGYEWDMYGGFDYGAPAGAPDAGMAPPYGAEGAGPEDLYGDMYAAAAADPYGMYGAWDMGYYEYPMQMQQAAGAPGMAPPPQQGRPMDPSMQRAPPMQQMPPQQGLLLHVLWLRLLLFAFSVSGPPAVAPRDPRISGYGPVRTMPADRQERAYRPY